MDIQNEAKEINNRNAFGQYLKVILTHMYVDNQHLYRERKNIITEYIFQIIIDKVRVIKY